MMRVSTSKSSLLPTVRAALARQGYNVSLAAHTGVRLAFALAATLEKRRAEMQSAEASETPAEMVLTVAEPAEVPVLVELMAQVGYVLLKQEMVLEMDFSEPIRLKAARVAAGLAQAVAAVMCLLGCGFIGWYWALFLYYWAR